MTTKRIEYPISATYCKNWTIIDAIREVIANALDEGNCKITYDASLNGCFVINEGSQIKPKHLVLGNSEKSDQQIGQFGEGMKIASLVCARLNRKFKGSTNEFSFQPSIEYHKDLDSDILVITLSENKQQKNETVIYIECSREEYNQAKQMFLKWSKCKSLSEKTANILTPGGKLFVNGLMTMEIPSIFSYNITSKEFINRDRTVVDLNKARNEMENIVEKEGLDNKTFCKEYLKVALTERKDELVETEFYLYGNSKVMEKELIKITGCDIKKVCIADGTQVDTVLKDEGYFVIRQTASWRVTSTLNNILGIRNSTNELNANPIQSVPDKYILSKDKLTEKIKENLAWSIELTRKVLKVQSIGECKVVEKFPSGEGTIAEYDKVKDTIYIRKDYVENGGFNLVGTLVHEVIHKIYGVGDRTREFENIMTALIGDLAVLAQEQLKERRV